MNYTTEKDSLMGISRKDAADSLQTDINNLEYYAWPEVFGTTSGPFYGIGGASMSTFTIEAWVNESTGECIYFCLGKVLGKREKFVARFQK